MSALAQPVFTLLPTNFRPTSMRADGSMLGGGYNYDGLESWPGTWTPAGGIVPLSLPTGFNRGEVASLSADGSVAAGQVSVNADSYTRRAAIWQDGQARVLDQLPDVFNSTARAVSGDGSTAVGWSSTIGGTLAFRWTAQHGLEELSEIDGFGFSEALDVSHDGAFVAGNTDVGGCRWGPAGETLIIPPVPGGSVASTSAISADGRVIAGTADILVPGSWPRHGFFRWTEESGTEFLGRMNPELDTAMSIATHMSADGNVIVGVNSIAGEPSAIYWSRATGLVDLNVYLASLGVDLDRSRLFSVRAVSDDGSTISGFGYSPGVGYTHWMVSGVPAPGVLSIAAIGASIVTRRRRA